MCLTFYLLRHLCLIEKLINPPFPWVLSLTSLQISCQGFQCTEREERPTITQEKFECGNKNSGLWGKDMTKFSRNLWVWRLLIHCSLSMWLCCMNRSRRNEWRRSHVICEEWGPEVHQIKEAKIVKKTQEILNRKRPKGRKSLRTTCHELDNLFGKKFTERWTF